MKYFLLISVSFMLIACESSPIRREDYIAQHPEWQSDVVDVIRRGYLLKGMTKEQVEAAWGRHCYSCTGTTTGDWGESWEYMTQIVFFDKNGVVVRWQSK